MAAIDEPSLLSALEFMRGYEDGLSSVRYPRDNVSSRLSHEQCPEFVLGRARNLTPGVESPDLAVLAFGTPAIAALEAAASLEADYSVAVYDARFAKPVDRQLLSDLLERGIPVLTVEDHSVIGGFGAAVLEAASEMRLDASRVRVHGMPDSWIMQDSRAAQLSEVGLDTLGIIRTIRQILSEEPRRGPGSVESSPRMQRGASSQV